MQSCSSIGFSQGRLDSVCLKDGETMTTEEAYASLKTGTIFDGLEKNSKEYNNLKTLLDDIPNITYHSSSNNKKFLW